MGRQITVRILCVIVLTIFSTACRHSSQYGATWDPSDARYFDDGISVLADIGSVAGTFAIEAQDELTARVYLSDVIAIATVTSIHSSTDADGRAQKRIGIVLDRILYGKSRIQDFELISSQQSLGYPLLLRHENRLQGEHLLFLRLFKNRDQTTGHHFHLAPPSPSNIERVNQMVKTRLEMESTKQP